MIFAGATIILTTEFLKEIMKKENDLIFPKCWAKYVLTRQKFFQNEGESKRFNRNTKIERISNYQTGTKRNTKGSYLGKRKMNPNGNKVI